MPRAAEGPVAALVSVICPGTLASVILTASSSVCLGCPETLRPAASTSLVPLPSSLGLSREAPPTLPVLLLRERSAPSARVLGPWHKLEATLPAELLIWLAISSVASPTASAVFWEALVE